MFFYIFLFRRLFSFHLVDVVIFAEILQKKGGQAISIFYVLISPTSYCIAYSFYLLSFKDPGKKKKMLLLSSYSSL